MTCKPSSLLLNLNKELKLFFHCIKFMIFETLWSKKRKLLSCSTLLKEKLLNSKFWYNSKPVGFRAISMSFLNFSCQKTYPGKFSRPEVIWDRSYQWKSSIQKVSWSTPIWYLFKTPETLKCLELEANISRAFIYLWYLPLVKISKKKEIRVTWSRNFVWCDMELIH